MVSKEGSFYTPLEKLLACFKESHIFQWKVLSVKCVKDQPSDERIIEKRVVDDNIAELNVNCPDSYFSSV